eukprot:Clim_evm30s77 gene=Clim_evmTU30s77
MFGTLTTIIWYFNGKKHYTKSGYQARAKDFVASDTDVSLKGLHYVITGANSGIGYEASRAFAKAGATVHMICRSKDKAEKARQEIVQETKNTDVQVHLLDMSKLHDIQKFADDWVAGGIPINCLVQNAGVMMNDRKTTDEGFDFNFATNSLGPHLLVRTLLPALKKGSETKSPSRVIYVSSGGALTEKLSLDLNLTKLKPYKGTTAYAQQKRQQLILVELLQEKFSEEYNTAFFSMHPGWADTIALQESMPDFHKRMKDDLRNPQEGADTVVWLGMCERLKLDDGGKFYEDRASVPTHLPLSFTKESTDARGKLWDEMERMSKEKKP